MKIPVSKSKEYPWRIHQLAQDFKLIDLWEISLKTPAPETNLDFQNLHETVF